ncbi:hypothetical protein EUGRSUZ_A00676 [Eucalyptus grandis]|uniref:Uncharacterized protein n=2 Tax=Eucalyptus grandis TaxID=71139 RepID=A0ACC3M0M4_EUCGR|nr:hypothetical protein EUGRSUZ_A00676 [Eucalyptus grandis]
MKREKRRSDRAEYPHCRPCRHRLYQPPLQLHRCRFTTGVLPVTGDPSHPRARVNRDVSATRNPAPPSAHTNSPHVVAPLLRGINNLRQW